MEGIISDNYSRLFIFLHGATQRFALPALGWGRRSRPARKMIRRVKLLGMCAESPASGARFVSPLFAFMGLLGDQP
jgi:hypothetical protein